MTLTARLELLFGLFDESRTVAARSSGAGSLFSELTSSSVSKQVSLEPHLNERPRSLDVRRVVGGAEEKTRAGDSVIGLDRAHEDAQRFTREAGASIGDDERAREHGGRPADRRKP